MDNLKDDILLFIQINQKKSNNKCGTQILDITENFGIDYKTARDLIIKLYLDKKITTRKGINTNLIFLNE